MNWLAGLAGLGQGLADAQQRQQQQELQRLRIATELQNLKLRQDQAANQDWLGKAMAIDVALPQLEPTSTLPGAQKIGGDLKPGMGRWSAESLVAQGLNPALAKFVGRESGGDPNVGYGGADLSNAPRDDTGFPQWSGKRGPAGMSHAAGFLQDQPGTWRPIAKQLGITDFSVPSQIKVNNELYRQRGEAPWAATGGRVGARPRPAPRGGSDAEDIEGYIRVPGGLVPIQPGQPGYPGDAKNPPVPAAAAGDSGMAAGTASEAGGGDAPGASAPAVGGRQPSALPPPPKPPPEAAQIYQIIKQRLPGIPDAQAAQVARARADELGKRYQQDLANYRAGLSESREARTAAQADERLGMERAERATKKANAVAEWRAIVGNDPAKEIEAYRLAHGVNAELPPDLYGKQSLYELSQRVIKENPNAPDDVKLAALRGLEQFLKPSEAAKLRADIAAAKRGASKNVIVRDADGTVKFKGLAHQTADGWVADKDNKPIEIPDGGEFTAQGPESQGRQAATQIQSMIGSTEEAVGAARNLMELPISATSGLFQGVQATQGKDLRSAVSRTLANKLTSAQATDLLTSFQGVQRALATIEAQGRATGLVTLTGMAAELMPQANDTRGNILRKYAEIRQIVERNTRGIMASPQASPEQKKELQALNKELAEVIPFTVHDVNELQYGSVESVRDAAKKFGLPGAVGDNEEVIQNGWRYNAKTHAPIGPVQQP